MCGNQCVPTLCKRQHQVCGSPVKGEDMGGDGEVRSDTVKGATRATRGDKSDEGDDEEGDDGIREVWRIE